MKTKLFLRSTIFLLSVCLITVVKLNAQSVSAGAMHSVAICNDSIPRVWGAGSVGQLGLGTTSFRTIPTAIPSLTQIVEVSAAASMTLFLKVDGTVWACGDNQMGQLGDGTTTTQYTPVQSPSLSNIIAISAGGAHSLFLKADGTVWASGNNQVGQLGDGTNVNKVTPIQIPTLSDIIAVSAGATQSLFLKNDGTVYLCGYFAAQNTPVQIVGLSGITKISAGDGYALFLKNDGTVMGVGSNSYGQLGDGTTDGAITPVAVNTLTDIVEIKAGPTGSSFFLKNDGTVWACGINNAGQFGTGVNTGFDPNPNPTQLTDLSNIVALTTGWYHSVFVKNDQSAQSSGGNSQGQLGNATSVNSWSLVSVSNMCAPVSTWINERMDESLISVFPNPSTGIFTLTFENNAEDKLNIEIYNVVGELVFLTSNVQQQMKIDLSDLPKGIYFVKIFNDSMVYNQKVLIQ
ncbi:MAG: T9SS type A sorting domain-containing protein [Bacteroidia bacterium]|nr:T9SS type A sorting domain-containing protein [Bacteroidia bacterium]